MSNSLSFEKSKFGILSLGFLFIILFFIYLKKNKIMAISC